MIYDGLVVAFEQTICQKLAMLSQRQYTSYVLLNEAAPIFPKNCSSYEHILLVCIVYEILEGNINHSSLLPPPLLFFFCFSWLNIVNTTKGREVFWFRKLHLATRPKHFVKLGKISYFHTYLFSYEPLTLFAHSKIALFYILPCFSCVAFLHSSIFLCVAFFRKYWSGS